MMRKSVSLSNVDDGSKRAVDGEVGSVPDVRQDIAVDETDGSSVAGRNDDESAELPVSEENKTFIKIRVDHYSRPDCDEVDTDKVVRKIKPAGAVIDFGNKFNRKVETLPISVGRKRTAGGLVPKMRLMFERARSLEPEARSAGRRRVNRFADGTESVTSFVLEEAPDKTTASLRARSETRQLSSSSSSSSNSFEFEDPASVASSTASGATVSNNLTINTGSSTNNKKGFVNKCMSRVRHFMGSKNGLQS